MTHLDYDRHGPVTRPAIDQGWLVASIVAATTYLVAGICLSPLGWLLVRTWTWALRGWLG